MANNKDDWADVQDSDRDDWQDSAPSVSPNSMEKAKQILAYDMKPDMQAFFNAAGTGTLGRAMPALKTFFGRLGANAAAGAVTDKENPLRGAAVQAGVGAGVEWLAKLFGKSGDVAMQMAVGRKKYTPGVGTELADQGIIGTQGMMKNQVGNRLAETGDDMGRLAARIPGGQINSPKIGAEIADEAGRTMRIPGGGAPSSADIGKLAGIKDFSEDVMSRGLESGPQALQRRIAAGGRSYRGTESPGRALEAQLSKMEQAKYSQGLKEAYSKFAAPGEEMALANADKAYGALKRAEKALSEEVSIPRSLMGLMSMTPKALPGGALVTSAVGQGLVKGGQAAAKAADPATLLLFRQLLDKNSTEKE